MLQEGCGGMENSSVQAGLSRDAAMEIAKRHAQRVRNMLDSDAKVILFGSAARNEANENSDIEVAVASELFGDDMAGDFTRVNVLAYGVDMRISAMAVAYKGWERLNPFALQIKAAGVLV